MLSEQIDSVGSSEQIDSAGSIDFSDVQIVHKFSGWVTSNPYLKGTPLFSIMS